MLAPMARRIILPKKAAEAFLPTLESEEGILMIMHDLAGFREWSFKYRFWPNRNGRMYVLENIGRFVNNHGLRLGDSIMLYQDIQNHNYVIQAKKNSDQTGSFIYDTTFSNDSPFDFLSESMTKLSRMGRVDSFDSIENLLDEF